MLKLLYKALNVRPEEESRVLLLLANGFFMGIFMAAYQITSETLFIKELGDYVSEGIFVAGLLGVFTTALFVFLQNKISYSNLAVLNVFTISIITLTFYFLLQNADQQYRYLIVFALYAMKGPMIAVILLGFWGVFGRMFDLRQSKRIIGGIDTGQLSAAIFVFFTIGLSIDLLPSTEYLLIISSVSALISMIFLIIISKKFDLNVVKVLEGGSKARQTSLKDLFKNKYVVLLSLFLSFSAFAYLLVENSYLSVLNDQYPGDEEVKLRSFLGWFNGSILILSFIFQTFFNDRIIANYGLKISLLILPVVLTFFTVISILAGTFFGSTIDSQNFIWFFLFIALSKLFSNFLRDALENPTFKLYFMPLDNKIRFDIQAKVEGVVQEFAKFIAGGLILLLGLLAFFDLIHYSYVLILLIGIWVYFTGQLYVEYRNRIREKLQSQDASSEELLRPHKIIVNGLENELNHDNPEKAIFSFKLLEQMEPASVGKTINKLMKHPKNEVKNYAQKRLNEIRGLSVSERYIISFDANKTAEENQQVISGLDLESLFRTGDISKKRISKLCRSEKVGDRLYAAELIGNSESKEITYLLTELLSDIEPKVRVAAMIAAEKNYNLEVLHALIENLRSAKYSNLAMNSLVLIGNKAMNAMESAFYAVGQNVQVMIKILQIYGEIGTAKAQELLWNKIDFPDKILVSQVLESLGDCGFKASIQQVTRIKYAIEEDVGDIAWNLAAIGEIPQNDFSDELKQAIKEENANDIEHIYTLLSMLYDPKSIQLVKENLSSGTSEGITYAIELLDVFLSEDLKQKIIPLLDEIPEAEKAKKLESYYPREPLAGTQVLKFLINRDFNQTNRWSKSSAIYQIGKMKIQEYEYDLIANLFNPDKMVSETAAWSLYQINPALYFDNIKRIDIENQQDFEASIHARDNNPKPLRYEMVNFINKMELFTDTPGRMLANVVDDVEEVMILKGVTYSLSGENMDSFYIIYKGDLKYYNKGSMIRIVGEGDFLGELIDDGSDLESNILIAQSDSLIFKFNKDKFYEILSDNFLFANNVINHLYAG